MTDLDEELRAWTTRVESDVADLALALQQLRDELADAGAGGNVKAAEPSFADLEEWVVGYLSGTFARPVTASWRWCPQWWDHPEAEVRLKALLVAWREAQQTGRMLAWLRDLDAQLAVLTDPAGTFAACTPREHRPADPLPTQETS